MREKMQMRKVFNLLTLIISVLLFIPSASAQFANPPSLPNVAYASQTFTAAGNAVVNVNGLSSATLEITGTYSAVSFNLQCSNNTTFVSLPVTLVSGGPVTTLITGASTAADGVYYTSLTGCTKVKFLVNSITGTSIIARLVGAPASTLQIPFFNPLTSGDPCMDRTIAKTNVAVSITSATTTLLVDASTGKKIYPCNFQATVGASTTVSFEYGTKVSTDCDTGPTLMTGVFTPATAAELTVSDLGPTPVSQQFCAVSTGTGGIKGVLTYVQQ
jgi:hypothetical protein